MEFICLMPLFLAIPQIKVFLIVKQDKCYFVLAGNLHFLRSSVPFTKSTREAQSTNLIPYNGAVLNVSKLLEKAEQTENSRLYLENKIHTLELKLGECCGGGLIDSIQFNLIKISSTTSHRDSWQFTLMTICHQGEGTAPFDKLYVLG